MVLKHEEESKLLEASKQYDAALKEQDLDKLDSLVNSNYTIHADGITLKVVLIVCVCSNYINQLYAFIVNVCCMLLVSNSTQLATVACMNMPLTNTACRNFVYL